MSKLSISTGHSAVGVWLWSCQGLGVSSGGAYLDQHQHQQGRCCPAQHSSNSLLGGVRRCSAAAAATSPMPPTSICTHLCSLYLTIAVFCSLCLPATEFPYQELTPKCLGHGKKFAWKPSNDITIIEHIVQIWHRFLFRRFLFNGQE